MAGDNGYDDGARFTPPYGTARVIPVTDGDATKIKLPLAWVATIIVAIVGATLSLGALSGKALATEEKAKALDSEVRLIDKRVQRVEDAVVENKDQHKQILEALKEIKEELKAIK